MLDKPVKDVWGNPVGGLTDEPQQFHHWLGRDESARETQADRERAQRYRAITGGEPSGGVGRGRLD